MTAKDKPVSKPASDEYRSNYDKIFGGKMNHYSVIFLRPQYLSDEIGNEHDTDTYVALVTAGNMKDAVKVGREELFRADKKDKFPVDNKADYILLFVISGHVDVLLYGWQA